MDDSSNDISTIQQELNEYWDERSISYSDLIKNQMESPQKSVWEAMILNNVPEKGSLHILDIGCGPGFFSILMAQQGHRVHAVDYSAEMLRYAEENASQYGVDITCTLLEEDNLPFANETFDMVISRDVTWTLVEPEQTMREWGRVLKKGGRLLYFDANWYYHLNHEAARKEYSENQEKIRKANMDVYSKANQMDSIAKNLPLSRQLRPDWDLSILPELGFEVVHVMNNINPIVYREDEQVRYESKPEFLVVAKKQE